MRGTTSVHSLLTVPFRLNAADVYPYLIQDTFSGVSVFISAIGAFTCPPSLAKASVKISLSQNLYKCRKNYNLFSSALQVA